MSGNSDVLNSSCKIRMDIQMSMRIFLSVLLDRKDGNLCVDSRERV